MRKILAKAGCCLATAWALASGDPLLGQVPQPLPPALGAAVPLGPDEDFGGWTVAHVKLAWLGDPTTFRLNLGAHVNPQGLVVYGFVPSEAIRRQALQVARQASSLAVVDALKVHPSMDSGYASPAASDDLRHAVDAMVKSTLSERSVAVQVVVRNGDQVVLSGQVGTLAERLQLSFDCRKLAGCGCVINRLDVTPALRVAGFSGGTSLVPLTASPAPNLEYWLRKGDIRRQYMATADFRRYQSQAPQVLSAYVTAHPNLLPHVQTTPNQMPTQPTPEPVFTGAYESSGVLVVDDDDMPAVSPSASTSAVVPAAASSPAKTKSIPPDVVREKIVTLCDGQVSDIEFALRSPGQLEVTLKVRQGIDFESLGNRILAMPELAGYRTSFVISYGQ